MVRTEKGGQRAGMWRIARAWQACRPGNFRWTVAGLYVLNLVVTGSGDSKLTKTICRPTLYLSPQVPLTTPQKAHPPLSPLSPALANAVRPAGVLALAHLQVLAKTWEVQAVASSLSPLTPLQLSQARHTRASRNQDITWISTPPVTSATTNFYSGQDAQATTTTTNCLPKVRRLAQPLPQGAKTPTPRCRLLELDVCARSTALLIPQSFFQRPQEATSRARS